jgi:hypothetical protein
MLYDNIGGAGLASFSSMLVPSLLLLHASKYNATAGIRYRKKFFMTTKVKRQNIKKW